MSTYKIFLFPVAPRKNVEEIKLGSGTMSTFGCGSDEPMIQFCTYDGSGSISFCIYAAASPLLVMFICMLFYL
jgi:hypothetical protein